MSMDLKWLLALVNIEKTIWKIFSTTKHDQNHISENKQNFRHQNELI